jgi:hypothetical protein
MHEVGHCVSVLIQENGDEVYSENLIGYDQYGNPITQTYYSVL